MEEYTQITLDEWVQWKEDIRQKLAETANNFVYIGYRLKQIRDSGMFGGAADIFEFAQKEYGLGKSTVSRFIAINEKYSEGGNSLELREEFRKFSSSKLSEMLTLPDKEIELINERTTIRAIRELKKFDAEDPEKAREAEAVTERKWEPLEKCVIDFFKDKKEALGRVMEYLEKEEPDYKQAAEVMAPSGQAFHKKGIVFLFLYEWKDGVKYKLMTSPDPVAMTWGEFLNIVYGIYDTCTPGKVWEEFYGKEAEEKVEKSPENQGLEPVATSQQEEEKQERNAELEKPAKKQYQTPVLEPEKAETAEEEVTEEEEEEAAEEVEEKTEEVAAEETEKEVEEEAEEEEQKEEDKNIDTEQLTEEAEERAEGSEDADEDEEEAEEEDICGDEQIKGLIQTIGTDVGRVQRKLYSAERNLEKWDSIRISLLQIVASVNELIKCIGSGEDSEDDEDTSNV